MSQIGFSIELLRYEAKEMKDCFTRYSFQTIAICSVAFGLLIRFQQEEPLLGLSGIVISLLSLSVARIGIYKYTSSNRHYGFELFMSRLNRMSQEDSRIPIDDIKSISWEEAMRAWRIVQPTIFRNLYTVTPQRTIQLFGKPNEIKSEFKGAKEQWFDVESLIVDGATHYSGSYMRTMLSILYILVVLAFIPMLLMLMQYFNEGSRWHISFTLPIIVLIIAISASRMRQLSARRKMIESGILSIHASAIVWHLTVLAHFEALKSLRKNGSSKVKSFRGYTQSLSQQAVNLTAYIDPNKSVYDWIEEIS